MQLLSSYIRIPASDIEEIIKLIKSGNFVPSILMFLKIAGVLIFIVIVLLTILSILSFICDYQADASDRKNKPKKIPVEKLKQISESETKQSINQIATNLAQQYVQKNQKTDDVNGGDEQPELQTETKNTQDSENISDSKTRKAITQTAKAIAKAHLEETSEKEEQNSETEAQTGRKFRMLGKAARSLTKKYLDDNKQ